LLCPALAPGRPSPLQRRLGPALAQLGLTARRRVVRLDLFPADFDHGVRALALESILCQTDGRRAVTYDQLAGCTAAHRFPAPLAGYVPTP